MPSLGDRITVFKGMAGDGNIPNRELVELYREMCTTCPITELEPFKVTIVTILKQNRRDQLAESLPTLEPV